MRLASALKFFVWTVRRLYTVQVGWKSDAGGEWSSRMALVVFWASAAGWRCRVKGARSRSQSSTFLYVVVHSGGSSRQHIPRNDLYRTPSQCSSQAIVRE